MKKQQRKTVRAIFEDAEQLTLDQLQESNILKLLLKAEVPNAIEYAIIHKKTFASIFEINSSNNFIEIHKNYWADALSTCLHWYINDGEEDYEKCSHLTKLIESLRIPKK
jgi:poly(A) polymerase Pap1